MTVYCALFTALIIIGGYISIPIPVGPVPIVLADFFVMVTGLFLGFKYGLISTALYLALGALGLPVFAGGSAGLAVLVGPTGGFLFGYLLVVASIGFITGKRKPSIEASIGRTLREVSISKQEVHQLYDLAEQNGAYIQTYIGNNIITERNNEYCEMEKVITGMEIVEVLDFKSYVDRDVIKAIVLQHPDTLKSVAERIRFRVPDTLNMTFSKPFFLEFMNSEVNKGVSIDYLADRLGISMDAVIAVGDSYNDISMVERAGLGVAMGNGVDALKEIAGYIAKSNMEDGVAEVVYRFMLVESISTQHEHHNYNAVIA